MTLTTSRRAVTFGLMAAGLVSCGPAIPGGGGAGSSSGTIAPPPRPVPNAGYDNWVAAFKGRAARQGISAGVLDNAFSQGGGYLPTVIENDRNQTEFTRTLEDYLAIAASTDRVSKGRANLARHSGVLSQIEARYGVEAAVVVAVWGMESTYGERRGNIPVIAATSTLAYQGRRGSFFEQQLVAALKILQNGDVPPAGMTGSWAGAMGHTQFIPTSYLLYAVDFNGDGRRDIWSNDPTDSLASTAAYLQRSGWQRGQPWGVEVRLPSGFSGPFGRGSSRSPSAWASMGVRAASGGTVPDYGPASIITPQGRNGPAFMTFRNFTVITRYNNAEKYVIGVGHLSDRLRGGAPIQGSFPPDQYGLTIDDRRRMQSRLTAMGYDTKGTDGVVGPATREAISAFQRSRGLPATGEPSRALVQMLG